MHVVARGRAGLSDNLLFDGRPLGNNNTRATPRRPPVRGWATDPACNTVTDVQNDSICVLGRAVTTKSPGRQPTIAPRPTARPRRPGSGVDIDVIRIPDRALAAGRADAVVQVRAAGHDVLAPGVIAVSVDLPDGGR